MTMLSLLYLLGVFDNYENIGIYPLKQLSGLFWNIYIFLGSEIAPRNILNTFFWEEQ